MLIPIIALLIPILAIALTGLNIYVFLTTRTRERLAMIEKGAIMDFESRERKPKPHGNSSLKWGMILIGLALGLVVGHVLSLVFLASHNDNPIFYFSMVLLFGGLALVLYHNIEYKRQQAEKAKQESA